MCFEFLFFTFYTSNHFGRLFVVLSSPDSAVSFIVFFFLLFGGGGLKFVERPADICSVSTDGFWGVWNPKSGFVFFLIRRTKSLQNLNK